MKFIVKLTLLALLALELAACGKSNPGLSLGVLGVNGPGIDGSVPAGTKRVYTLLNINKDQYYTVRTEISQLTPTIADGTLAVSIYESEAAFKSDPTTSVTTLAPQTDFPYVYEVYFQAPSSGNYVAVISGASQTVSNIQFFYNLRFMSADPNAPAATTPLTSFATLTIPAYQTLTVNPGYLQVYNGSTLTPQGIYPIKLASTMTTTIGYPQLFVYNDSTLKIESLLYSSVTDSANFYITSFATSTVPMPPDPNNNITSGVTITGVSFTSGGPFIVVKGTSAAQYTLTVGP